MGRTARMKDVRGLTTLRVLTFFSSASVLAWSFAIVVSCSATGGGLTVFDGGLKIFDSGLQICNHVMSRNLDS